VKQLFKDEPMRPFTCQSCGTEQSVPDDPFLLEFIVCRSCNAQYQLDGDRVFQLRAGQVQTAAA
jgi:transcription elongation factor Elf1